MSWLRRRDRLRRSARTDAAAAGLDPRDVADLERRLADVTVEEAHQRDAQLVVQLRRVIERRTPIRCIDAPPSVSAPRIRFADGTAVMVHGETPGDLGILAAWMHQRSVLATGCTVDAAGTHLTLAAYGSHRVLTVTVAGLAQPD